MSISVLLTSASEDSDQILDWLNEQDMTLMHLPLERYTNIDDYSHVKGVLEDLQEFETIIYGHKRSAMFFMKQVEQHQALHEVRQRVNLTLDQATAQYLEEAGIPAIHAPGSSKPIDLVEFMLRLRRMGSTLYPCGRHTKEEIPGFLEELDIPVHELELYDLEGPSQESLKSYRSAVAQQQPDVIIFHSRMAVNRIRAAFPELNYSECTILSADTAVTNKLEAMGISVTLEADGSWSSVIEKLSERV